MHARKSKGSAKKRLRIVSAQISKLIEPESGLAAAMSDFVPDLSLGDAKVQVGKTFLNSIPETEMGSRKGNPNPPIGAPDDLTMLLAILCIDREVK